MKIWIFRNGNNIVQVEEKEEGKVRVHYSPTHKFDTDWRTVDGWNMEYITTIRSLKPVEGAYKKEIWKLE